MVKIDLVDAEDYNTYSNIFKQCLQEDWENRGEPDDHFFHNMDLIDDAFRVGEGLVAVKDNQEVVGYMIWDVSPPRVKFSIVEVKEAYRRQGIFKQMQQCFSEHHPDVLFFLVCAIKESVNVFRHAGWCEHEPLGDLVIFYKPAKNCLLPQKSLCCQGVALEICVEDYELVQAERDHCSDKMIYFSLQLDEFGKLPPPIITEFHHDGYIAIYLNGKKLANGKARNLFNKPGIDWSLNLLALDSIVPTPDKEVVLAPALAHKFEKRKRRLSKFSVFAEVNIKNNDFEQAKQINRLEHIRTDIKLLDTTEQDDNRSKFKRVSRNVPEDERFMRLTQ